MEQVRVFVAVDLPAALQGRLGFLVERLQGLSGEARWVSGPHLHLTLRFLGELDVQRVPAVTSAVARVASQHAPFVLTLAGLGLFPPKGPPNVVWLGVAEGEAALRSLQANVETELELAGFPPEERRFTPHLTLARLRGAEAAEWRRAISALGSEPVLSFRVEAVHVMRSELTRRGPLYSTLSVVSLGPEFCGVST